MGTLPPPRFTSGELKPGDVDFCYGSRDGLLWPILDRIFSLGLKFETTEAAVQQRKEFLIEYGIGISDIVASARREKIDASDLGMQDVELRDLLRILEDNDSIETLLFMGGNSKNGPEYFFRRLLRSRGIPYKQLNSQLPRIHSVKLPASGRLVRTVTLIAPSGSANRAIGSIQEYKDRKARDPRYNTIDFRVAQYRPFFKD